jgi:hypothetical protein
MLDVVDAAEEVPGLHDMGDPVAAAAAARRDGEALLLVEPAAGDRLSDNLNPIGVSPVLETGGGVGSPERDALSQSGCRTRRAGTLDRGRMTGVPDGRGHLSSARLRGDLRLPADGVDAGVGRPT